MNPNRLRHCAILRRGHLCAPALFELPSIETHLKPLITGLHKLFYPLQDPNFRAYNTTVTVELVHDVCGQVCGALCD